MSLLDSLRAFCERQGLEKTYWVAYSGGLDSHVLLSLCHALRAILPIKLCAIHINHGLSQHAVTWALHCKKTCEAYEIDYAEKTIHLGLKAGDSLEEVARLKRHAAFAEMLAPDDILLTAHHQDDQAETVLLQLIRGTGLKGLAAMPKIKPFARGFHARPLLDFTRTELESYAHENKLKWIEDESNQDLQLTRNYLRHHILSSLKNRWPTITKTLSRSALHCAEAQALLEEFATEINNDLKGERERTLSVSKLLQLSPQKQKLMLRTWMLSQGHLLPDIKKLVAIQTTVLTAARDGKPCVHWKDTEVRRYRDDLYIMNRLPLQNIAASMEWDLSQPVASFGNQYLQASLVHGRGLARHIKTISLRFRRGGEVIEIPGRGHHTLKNLFQEWKIPPWERDRLPLIFLEEKLIGVAGYFLSNGHAVKKDEQGWEIRVVPAKVGTHP